MWLAAQGVSYGRLLRWRTLVVEGDLNHVLTPRQSVPSMMHQGGRRSLERQRARERAAQEAEVARLAARVKELETVNESLGKAIGLLHQMSEQEPDETPNTSDAPAS